MISTSKTAKDKSWGVVKVDLRDSFEAILKSAGEYTMGSEEEDSWVGKIWEGRNANVPVCGDESRGNRWRRRLCPIERRGQSKPIGFAMEPILYSLKNSTRPRY